MSVITDIEKLLPSTPPHISEKAENAVPTKYFAELFEELVLQNAKEAELELPPSSLTTEAKDVTFKLKYLGNTVLEKITGENVSSNAIKNIIKTSKGLKRKKLQTVNLNVSSQGITITDLQGADILNVSIYRISNCSTDAAHPQIFSFISTDANETSKCHAFLCSKRKVAQTVTLTVANVFSTAYQAWQQLPQSNEDNKLSQNAKENQKNNLNHIAPAKCKTGPTILQYEDSVKEEMLIDLDSEPRGAKDIFSTDEWSSAINPKRNWVSFEDDFHVDPFKS